ncbi:MAG: type II toxin-antitoxin system RelE/ParE family toxin [Nanoarchaeota archaeon]
MYEIIFDEEAIEFLNTLTKEIKERIFRKIISTKENPFHFFERLSGRSEYKLRIGDYRVIADIDQGTKKVNITFVGHKKKVYNLI